MGTCDCGKKTVWNDMCQNCNDKWDDQIYSMSMYDEEPEHMETYSSNLSPVLDSKILDLMLDVRDIICLHGPVVEEKDIAFCISMKDGSDFLFLKSKMKHDEDQFTTECERVKRKFAEYRSMN